MTEAIKHLGVSLALVGLIIALGTRAVCNALRDIAKAIRERKP